MGELEKQIEEMAKDFGLNIYWDEDEIPTINCLETATRLYLIGYRKQRECENLTENHPVDEFICSECGLITRENTRIEIDEDADGDESQYEFEFRFCPRCGRKVKEKE